MAKIRIDQEALLTNSQALENRIRELQELNTRLESLIVRIQSSWEGQASIAYVTKMLVHITKARQTIDVLREYKNYVDKAVSKFTEVDNNAANRIRGSF